MKKNGRDIKLKVKIDDLECGMQILAFNGFSTLYDSMNSDLCKFIRHNFQGTNSIVLRKGWRLTIPIDEIRTGDSLLRIYNFPKQLEKFTIITAQFIKELKLRGMHHFIVRKKVPLADDLKRALKEIINQVEDSTISVTASHGKQKNGRKKRKNSAYIANRFIGKVKECIEIRHEAVLLIQNTMDKARKGKTDVREIKNFIDTMIGHNSVEAMSALVTLKESSQTYEHCIDVGVIFQNVYPKILEKKGWRNSFKSENQVMLSGFLHDFGKSKVPKDILGSANQFEIGSREMKLMRDHTLYGAVLLSEVDMPSVAINMAHYHHIKQDTAMMNSYPVGIDWQDVSFETRLLSLIDVYQALVGRRKYKKSWAAPAAMRFLDALAGIEFDLEVWEAFLQEMGWYPVGSLVELNDSSLGFVMNVPGKDEDPCRPMISVVRSPKGEDLETNFLVDLQQEKDMSISKDIDYKEIYGDKALDVFTNVMVA